MSILASIRGPEDVKALAPEQLPQLAQEIRERLVAVTAKNGGHIGPNLGVVELSIALHRVFGTPRDKFVFDVAHQGYVHKLLTGRNGADFDGIRTTGGLSGFLNREESLHDVFGAGHAGTALSAAVGLANARDRLAEDSHVVALIGDAALTCGVTMEALNNAAKSTKRLVIVLNDNEWSIDRNVGAIADIPIRTDDPVKKRTYDPQGKLTAVDARVWHGSDYHEKPTGEWNLIECFSLNGDAVFRLNGKTVNVILNSRYREKGSTVDIPLRSGKLQIQSEAAECEYRRLQIRPLTAWPADVAKDLPSR